MAFDTASLANVDLHTKVARLAGRVCFTTAVNLGPKVVINELVILVISLAYCRDRPFQFLYSIKHLLTIPCLSIYCT